MVAGGPEGDVSGIGDDFRVMPSGNVHQTVQGRWGVVHDDDWNSPRDRGQHGPDESGAIEGGGNDRDGRAGSEVGIDQFGLGFGSCGGVPDCSDWRRGRGRRSASLGQSRRELSIRRRVWGEAVSRAENSARRAHGLVTIPSLSINRPSAVGSLVSCQAG